VSGPSGAISNEIVLRAAEQPVGCHRDPVAVDDRVGRRDCDCRGQDAGGQYVDARPDEEGRTAEPRPELEQQNSSDREEAADERRHERTEQQAGAEGGDQRADLTARQPLPLADDDERKQQAGADEVREPIEKRACAQKRLAPQEAEALREPRAQRREVRLAFLLERCPHREQREGRERVRNRIGEERERAAEPEERAADGRPDEADDRGPRCLCGNRRWQLAGWHDGA
jgi:hypothetical protein